MTASEIKNEFDLLYNNLSSNGAPPLDGYEMSVLLTKAQEELIITYYNGYNSRQMSVESTEEDRQYLSSLIKEKSNLFSQPFENFMGFKYTEFDKPEKLFFILRESVDNSNPSSRQKCRFYKVVNPVRQDDLHRILSDPFKQPNSRKVIRTEIDNKLRLYFTDSFTKYIITYLEQPEPIILEDLVSETINNESTQTADSVLSRIPDSLMRKIINRAVELAKAAYIGDLNAVISLNQRSQ